jgi:putative ABC transport system substrate-binding protein
MPVIGFMGAGTADVFASSVEIFEHGLADAGFAAGRNVVIEFRWADGHADRLPPIAAELVQRRVTVIVTSGGPAAALAAKAATSTVPIVFISGGDPVRSGLVPRLNQPGGNVTGFSLMFDTLDQKRLELLREMVPSATVVGALFNPRAANAVSVVAEVDAAARRLGLDIISANASETAELDAAFEQFDRARIGALFVTSDAFFSFGPPVSRVIALAAQHRVPAIYAVAANAADGGGLMSYGADLEEGYRVAGTYVGRILKGEKAGDLPIQQPTKFILVINLKTAKTLGLTVPPLLLARADEVIE